MNDSKLINSWVISGALLLGQLAQATSSLAATPSVASATTISAASISQQMQNPSYQNKFMLMQAIDQNDYERFKQHIHFVNSFANLNPEQRTYMNLEFTDQAGNTPLIRAALQNRLNMVHLLLNNGANINAVNLKYETAVIAAYNAGHYALAKQLLARGAQDSYHVAQHIAQYEQATGAAVKVSQPETPPDDNLELYAAGLGVGAAAALVAGVAGGSSKKNTSSSSSGSSGIPSDGVAPSNDCGAASGIHPEACSNTIFQTAEAAAQEGVLTMKADYALARGYDGRIFNRAVATGGALIDDLPDGNVKVAVIDSGVDLDHPDLDGNLLTGATCTTTGCTTGGQDISGHGTNVAGIIAAERNGIGMHGIAPQAKIIPIAAIGVSQGSTIAAFQYANANNAQVINNSWGLVYGGGDNSSRPIIDATGPVITSTHPTGNYTALTPTNLRNMITEIETGLTVDTNDITEIQTAVANNRLFVFSAGNSGLSQVGVYAGLPLYFRGLNAPPPEISLSSYQAVNPAGLDWSRHWATVVSLDDNNVISSFSNRCGAAKAWCIAAPGRVNLTTARGTTPAGDYESATGTSFAAPNFSGAIAVMLGAFPQLDEDDVLQILFNTATDLGAAGIDDVYGHGLVNLQKAVDPTTGGWTLAVASTGGTAPVSVPLIGGGLGLSGPFGEIALHDSNSLIFLDGYGKDYVIPLSAVANQIKKKQNSYDRFAAFGRNDFDTEIKVDDYTKLGFSLNSDPAAVREPISKDTVSMAMQTQLPLTKDLHTTAGFTYHADLAAQQSQDMPHQYSTAGAYKNPYLQMVDDGVSTELGLASGDVQAKIVTYAGDSNEQYAYRINEDRNMNGIYNELRYTPEEGNSLALSSGMVVEQDSILGSETGDAFGIDESVTYHAGLSGSYALTNSVSLLAQYHMGMTKVAAASQSLFVDFKPITTSAFSLGTEIRGVSDPSDTLGFVVSQPLRVSSGSAGLLLPVDIGSDKQIIYNASRLGLSPSARELNFESYYHYTIDDHSEFALNGLFRFSPENNSANDNEAAFMAKYKYYLGQ